MPEQSAGLILYRRRDRGFEFLIVHPGGPFWKSKHEGAWTIPKGRIEPGEQPLSAAVREFTEETGFTPTGPFIELTPVRLKGGKLIHAWASRGDADPSLLASNTFEVEWPPRSGRTNPFPEIDEARWCTLEEASPLLNPALVPLLVELLKHLQQA